MIANSKKIPLVTSHFDKFSILIAAETKLMRVEFESCLSTRNGFQEFACSCILYIHVSFFFRVT